jgi:hypothetical protein
VTRDLLMGMLSIRDPPMGVPSMKDPPNRVPFYKGSFDEGLLLLRLVYENRLCIMYLQF